VLLKGSSSCFTKGIRLVDLHINGKITMGKLKWSLLSFLNHFIRNNWTFNNIESSLNVWKFCADQKSKMAVKRGFFKKKIYVDQKWKNSDHGMKMLQRNIREMLKYILRNHTSDQTRNLHGPDNLIINWLFHDRVCDCRFMRVYIYLYKFACKNYWVVTTHPLKRCQIPFFVITRWPHSSCVPTTENVW
jgi:hypothetical protein